jgi:hypothetical protein
MAVAALLAIPGVEILGVSITTPIVTMAIQPYLIELSNNVMAMAPNVALTPQAAAQAVIRTAITKEVGYDEAAKAGLNHNRFDTLLAITGNPPPPQEMAVALRRGFVDEAAYELAIARGDLRNEYAPLVKRLATQQASPSEVLTAAVEGQLAPDAARAMFAAVGGAPEDYDWRLGTTGAAPSPVELFSMASKGVIPWEGSGEGVVSFEQGVKEGHSRNKWLQIWREGLVPIPPDRTIVAMVRNGALTEAQAHKYLAMHGTPPELISAYIKEATHGKVAAAKQLAESSVLALYEDKIIDRPTALGMTEALGYNAAEAEFILEIADFRTEAAALRTAVSRVHTLFVGHKIDATVAQGILGELTVPADRMTAIMKVWSIERDANVKILTEAQVVGAWGHSIIDTATAIAQLVGLGYDQADAVTLLAIHAKGPLTPAQMAGSESSQ